MLRSSTATIGDPFAAGYVTANSLICKSDSSEIPTVVHPVSTSFVRLAAVRN